MSAMNFLSSYSQVEQLVVVKLSLHFVPYFSKFIIIFQLVLRWIYRVTLEIVR